MSETRCADEGVGGGGCEGPVWRVVAEGQEVVVCERHKAERRDRRAADRDREYRRAERVAGHSLPTSIPRR